MAKRFARKRLVNGAMATKTPATKTGGTNLPAWLYDDWFFGVVLVLAIVLAYTPVWQAGFIWDDDTFVTANPCIVGPLGLKEIWTTRAADICPLTLTTVWAEHVLWGSIPLPYHLVNVFMHAGCAVLLWRVLRGLRIAGAWLGAALWALHPLQVQSVAWITEIKNTQSGFFFLLAILFFVKYVRARDAERRTEGDWSYPLALLFAALAMASKSSTVVLPIVFCLCAWWIDGRWRWRNLAAVAPVFFMSIAFCALSIWTQKMQSQSPEEMQYVRSLPERLATAGDAVWFYLGKSIWPYPLIFIYPRWRTDAEEWTSYLPLLAAITLLATLWFKRALWRRCCFVAFVCLLAALLYPLWEVHAGQWTFSYLLLVGALTLFSIIFLSILWFGPASWRRCGLFAFAYFLAALLPVLGLVDGYFWRYSLVGDHFQYLAGMGPLALVGAALVTLADSIMPKNHWLQWGLGAGLLLVAGGLTWQRAWDYEDLETLWRDTLAKNPNCWMAHNNLGLVLFQKGRVDDAMAQYQMASAISPNHADIHYNLGGVLEEEGQVSEAMAQYQQALKINPHHSEAHNNLGHALARQGRTEEAIAQFQAALEIDPADAAAHSNLGSALLQKGDVDGAIAQCQMALKIDPHTVDAHGNLGLALARKGDTDEAIAEFQKALAIDPDDAGMHYNLGVAWWQKGQVDDAIAEYQEALKIDSNYAGAHDDLGLALLEKGQLDEAIVQYQEALKIEPGNVEAHINLGAALFQKGRIGEAIIQFQNAVRLNPGDKSAQDNLAKAQAALRQKARQP